MLINLAHMCRDLDCLSCRTSVVRVGEEEATEGQIRVEEVEGEEEEDKHGRHL